MGKGIKVVGLGAWAFILSVIAVLWGVAMCVAAVPTPQADPLYRSPTGLTEIEMPHAWCYAWGDRTLSCVPK